MDLPDEAAVQGGLFTRRQARAAGWSAAQIHRRVSRGRWIEVVPSVFALAGTGVDAGTQVRAVQLATGGVLSHQTAATLWGMPVRAVPSIHVTVPRHARVRLPGVTAHHHDLADVDLDVHDGLPLTTRTCTLVDCLATLPEAQAHHLLDRALLLRWVDLDLLGQRNRLALGRRGTPQLVRLIRAASEGSRSQAERLLLRILRSARIRGWRAGVEIWDGVTLVAIVDVLFADVRLVIEVDGQAWHTDDARFQRDRVRQNLLVGLGYTVLRFTWDDVSRRPDYVAATVRTALRRLRTVQPAS